jgi:hypothetical protein
VEALPEDPGETVLVDRCRQAHALGSPAHPLAGFLAVAYEIVLAAGDLLGVVGSAIG